MLRFIIGLGFTCFLAMQIFISPALAGFRWLEGTETGRYGDILRDDARNLIYATDATQSRLLFIKASSETYFHISLPATPGELSISKDHSVLAISLGVSGIALVDLNAQSILRVIPTTEEVVSTAFDANGNLLYSTNTYWGSIVHLDVTTKSVIRTFGLGVNLTTSVYKGALLKTDSSGTTLYVGERGLSPASLTKIDISGDLPVFLAEDTHGSIGSNLQEFAVSDRKDFIYLTCGAPYGVQVLDKTTLTPVDLLSTGAYPGGVDLSKREQYLAGLRYTPYYDDIYLFDGESNGLIESFNLLDNPNVYNSRLEKRGAALNRDASKVFAIVGDSYPPASWTIQVMDTGVMEVNNPPIISVPQTEYRVKYKRWLVFTVTASDPDSDSVSLYADGLPTGATFDLAADGLSGTFSWRPSRADIGQHTVTFSVSDGELTQSASVLITVYGRQKK